MPPHRVFLLSPAFTGGKRGQLLLRPAAAFDLAVRLRSAQGAPLGEVFSFLSGLYFRGKLAYARAFSRPPAGVPGALVITTTRGLVHPDVHVTMDNVLEMAAGGIDAADAGYRAPLEQAAREVAEADPAAEVVLLGSIASGKYVDVLAGIFGDRLRFPAEFVGRGDMSRGGLLLRHVDAGTELEYLPVAGAIRRGPRPPRLTPR
ncbi:MAG TPA: hypothetical protein VFH27_01330 [Longimicrobiaceae bacterium]|nr:hypothetical protein [Longimicrobiaceae bacterium]